MKTVHLICAARPNFMKIAPLYHALKKTDWCKPVVVWGQQHTDSNMSEQFLVDFGVPNEDLIRFGVGAYSHAAQTAQAMISYDNICKAVRPDAIVVPGDVNTSMACALVGAKLGIPVVHLEAGLRSWDRSMPEEINRIVIDSISDLLWTPSMDADQNLKGMPKYFDKVVRVGNIMIDTLEMMRPQIEAVPRRPGPYAVVTLHRPSNVDSYAKLHQLWDEIVEVAEECMPVVFPVHPRTRTQLNFMPQHERVVRCPPMPYVEFMSLVSNANIVITDSGGVQEETSYLGIPCATVRENTERPITISHGTNELIGPLQIVSSVEKVQAGEWKSGIEIPLWDGKTAGRCAESLRDFLVCSPPECPCGVKCGDAYFCADHDICADAMPQKGLDQ